MSSRNDEHPTPLAAWMARQDISDLELTRALGFADRTLVFRVRKGQRPASREFKWRFLQHYGQPAAQEVFGPDLAPQENGEAHG